jgi:hypothetical protein
MEMSKVHASVLFEQTLHGLTTPSLSSHKTINWFLLHRYSFWSRLCWKVCYYPLAEKVSAVCGDASTSQVKVVGVA